MHRELLRFTEQLFAASSTGDLTEALGQAALAFGAPHFTYLCFANRQRALSRIISNYPSAWISRYQGRRYQNVDPVLEQVFGQTEPFLWGATPLAALSRAQQQLFDEAGHFGIRSGLSVPIHVPQGPVVAVTFASDHRRTAFEREAATSAKALQLVAMIFNAHARRVASAEPDLGDARLSAREFECLNWAAQGKSAPDIGEILSISRHTVAFHIENAKAKLGVRTITQAVARLSASRPREGWATPP